MLTDKHLFPNEEQHKKRWEDLAKNIARTKQSIQSKQHNSTQQGELIIIGSGIQTLNFIHGDKKFIEMADEVFYCVADPGTVTWIKTLRPDAYDLYVLYGNHKVRYITYVQMTEAMLYYVRQGKTVVAIYYGHPGIFALSPHRAICIAKQEGHKAIMKPGISALDCLCADLAVDPAHPGLQTHEASDLLIRNRTLDTSLHVVLWQVGLIGDQNFRDQGYINQNFPIFVEYLQKFYGEDYLVTHYIASRYPTIPPIIENYPLNKLYDPKIQLKINGISTFYLAPQKIMQTDEDMLQKLGMLKSGQSVKPQKKILRDMGEYGPREMLAFDDFERFRVPVTYRWQSDLAANRFIISLYDDPKMQSRYVSNPISTLNKFPDLTLFERRLLATRNSNNIQCVARGLIKRSLENETFLQAFFSKPTLVNQFLKVIEKSTQQTLIPTLNDWVQKLNYSPNWSTLYKSLARFIRERLYVWTGIYYSDHTKHLITIQGSTDLKNRGLFFINGNNIKKYQFAYGVMEWPKQGNIESGLLRLDIDVKGRRQLVGIVNKLLEKNSFFLPEINLNLTKKNLAFSKPLFSEIFDSYQMKIEHSTKHTLVLQKDTINIDNINYCISIQSNYVTWREQKGNYPVGNLFFFFDPITLTFNFTGNLLNEAGKKFTCYGTKIGIKAAFNQDEFFSLPYDTYSKLIKQCHQNNYSGRFLWLQSCKIQRATKILYSVFRYF